VLTSYGPTCGHVSERESVEFNVNDRQGTRSMTSNRCPCLVVGGSPGALRKVLAARAIGRNCTSSLLGMQTAWWLHWLQSSDMRAAGPVYRQPHSSACRPLLCGCGRRVHATTTRVFRKGSLCSRDERRNNGSRVQRSRMYNGVERVASTSLRIASGIAYAWDWASRRMQLAQRTRDEFGQRGRRNSGRILSLLAPLSRSDWAKWVSQRSFGVKAPAVHQSQPSQSTEWTHRLA
jgi:hypothetical protein